MTTKYKVRQNDEASDEVATSSSPNIQSISIQWADSDSTPSISSQLIDEKSIVNSKDPYYAVYFIFLLHGVGMLMSWNMFITIAPQYYRDYWFSFNCTGKDPVNCTETHYATSFMSVIGVTSQVPNVGIMFFNAALAYLGSLMIRIVVPLFVNCALVGVIIVFVIFSQPGPNGENMQWFYIVTLVIIMLMNLANGIYQSSVYGICADFPDNYINALIIGNNLCGIFTSLMSIATTLISPDDIELNALLYFAISLGILVCCLISLYILVRIPFYKEYMKLGEENRKTEDADNLSLAQYWDCLKHCWVQLFNNFFVYFISLTVFPAMMTDTPFYVPPGTNKHSVFPDNLYFAINTFLNFNVFAFVGSTIANYIQFPSPRWLFVPNLLRVVFIPFFMYCNYLPDTRKHKVFFESEWWSFFGCTIMALTCGYLSSLALIYTPSVVPPKYQKISGMMASIALMLGILAGVSFTPVISSITRNW
ncbi:unnamed protein product [Auanema sp. JU1783]|nr:unnamed protein product [Auanema sp. JU1783]